MLLGFELDSCDGLALQITKNFADSNAFSFADLIKNIPKQPEPNCLPLRYWNAVPLRCLAFKQDVAAGLAVYRIVPVEDKVADKPVA